MLFYLFCILGSPHDHVHRCFGYQIEFVFIILFILAYLITLFVITNVLSSLWHDILHECLFSVNTVCFFFVTSLYYSYVCVFCSFTKVTGLLELFVEYPTNRHHLSDFLPLQCVLNSFPLWIWMENSVKTQTVFW